MDRPLCLLALVLAFIIVATVEAQTTRSTTISTSPATSTSTSATTTTTSAATTTVQDDNVDDDGQVLSDGAIAGIVIGGVVLIALLIFLLVWFLHPACERNRSMSDSERNSRIREDFRKCGSAFERVFCCGGTCRKPGLSAKCGDCKCAPVSCSQACKCTCASCACEAGKCTMPCCGGVCECGSCRPGDCTFFSFEQSCTRCYSPICDCRPCHWKCGTCGDCSLGFCRCGPEGNRALACVCKHGRLECNRIEPSSYAVTKTETTIHITRDATVVVEEPRSKEYGISEPKGPAYGHLPPIDNRHDYDQ